MPHKSNKQPTREQWAEIERELCRPFGYVFLEIDGYDISLQVMRDGMKLVIGIYVEHLMRGAWIVDNCEERRKFLPERQRNRYTEKQRKLWAKLDGLTKRQLDKQKAEGTGLYEKTTFYCFHFNSFRAMKSKLVNNNECIEVVRIGHGS
ncbi:hypothetical protein AL013_10440 [Mariprofundus ferrooxydans]|uniref:hypothetical protein n=1 Tax=Mariprofundus ferrooxydans TaxID=314344 RepID=UPI0006C455A2|nr:hypothetical protein [Mariprofundus ferrooxydans]KON47002.1 hypothetical protein AL013_10440 [Mariprofundus ferrooxydans]